MPYDVEDRLTQTPKPMFHTPKPGPGPVPGPRTQTAAPRELQSSGDIHILIQIGRAHV